MNKNCFRLSANHWNLWEAHQPIVGLRFTQESPGEWLFYCVHPNYSFSRRYRFTIVPGNNNFFKLDGDDGECGGDYTSPYQYTIYVIVFNAVVWLLPSAIAGYLYYCVCVAVWRSAQGFHQKSQQSQIKLQSITHGLFFARIMKHIF